MAGATSSHGWTCVIEEAFDVETTPQLVGRLSEIALDVAVVRRDRYKERHRRRMIMKVGLDSYCFHRYFGEVYPGLQTDPGIRWRMESEFLDFALKQDIGEVALEACSSMRSMTACVPRSRAAST